MDGRTENINKLVIENEALLKMGAKKGGKTNLKLQLLVGNKSIALQGELTATGQELLVW
jgi:hypothetical protein